MVVLGPSTTRPAPHGKGEGVPAAAGWEAGLVGPCTEVLWFRNTQAHLGFCLGPVTTWDALRLAGLKTLTLRWACWGDMPWAQGQPGPAAPLSYVMVPRQPAFKVFFSREAATAASTKSLQSCPTLCDPTDGSPPGSPVHGILQARILEWVAISFSSREAETPAKEKSAV